MEEKKDSTYDGDTDSPISTTSEQQHPNLSNADIEANVNGHDGHKITKAVTAQDWTGPDDLDNPQNWPLIKKAYHVGFPALFALQA